jgi:uncharacterized protein (DUF2384 family)
MGAKPLVLTGQRELADQLAHPNHAVVWDRAIEVFGNIELARAWMNTPLPLLSNQTPESYAKSGEPSKQNEVLGVLIRIEYGIFS